MSVTKTKQADVIDQAGYRRQADDVLLDQAFFAVDENTFAEFHLLLDRPLPATDALRRFLKTKAPWE